MKANLKAWDLRTDLFNLIGKFKDLQGAVNAQPGEQAFEAAGQIDAVACRLAAIHDELPPVFTDAAMDTKDQQFGFKV